MIKNEHVDYYMGQYEAGEIRVSKYVALLFAFIKKHVLTRDDIYFDEEMHNNYIKFTEKYYFPLQPFQKFKTAFIFLFYKEGNYNFFEQFFFYEARGAGKNGLISSLSHFLISDLHGIKDYNVSLVANSEQQAKTSSDEIYNVIDNAGKGSTLQRNFEHKKSEIVSRTGKGKMMFHTSNAKTKDSLRDGAAIYDEVHEFADSAIVDVFSSGLGKVKNSREFYITTDGFVRGGFLDDLKERAINVLNGEALDDPLFVFMATLDSDEEMHDPDNWQKANPMFHEPRSEYATDLFRKVKTQYVSLKNSKPSATVRFMTKRMNRPATDLTSSVATIEEIKATNRPMPDLRNATCVGGLDFASVRDFASVGLLFKVGDNYIWKSHSFVRRGFIENVDLKIPISDWQDAGHLTIVDGPVIEMANVVNWFVEMREIYGITSIVADTFRLDIVKSALEAEGFHLLYIRNPKAIHSLLAPRVETLFAQENIIFGDNPLMRYFTYNVEVNIKKDGNREYLKKDEVRRKTDGFQAFIHALWQADNLLEEENDFMLADINF